MPLLFVGKVADAKKAAEIKASYNASPADPKRRRSLGGAVVSYAPSVRPARAIRELPTKTITFKAGYFVKTTKPATPNFYPEVDVAEVGIKPIQKLLSQPGFVTEVAYPELYKTDGFSPTANKGQIFLKLTSAKPLTFGGAGQDAKSDSLGALASPQMSFSGCRRFSVRCRARTSPARRRSRARSTSSRAANSTRPISSRTRRCSAASRSARS